MISHSGLSDERRLILLPRVSPQELLKYYSRHHCKFRPPQPRRERTFHTIFTEAIPLFLSHWRGRHRDWIKVEKKRVEYHDGIEIERLICLRRATVPFMRFFLHSRRFSSGPLSPTAVSATSIKPASLGRCQKRGFIRLGGVTSTGIVRLAHMEGPGLSPRDNRESLSSRYTWTSCTASFHRSAFTIADSSALLYLSYCHYAAVKHEATLRSATVSPPLSIEASEHRLLLHCKGNLKSVSWKRMTPATEYLCAFRSARLRSSDCLWIIRCSCGSLLSEPILLLIATWRY